MWLILERAHYKRKVKRQIVIVICAPKVAATSALYSPPPLSAHITVLVSIRLFLLLIKNDEKNIPLCFCKRTSAL